MKSEKIVRNTQKVRETFKYWGIKWNKCEENRKSGGKSAKTGGSAKNARGKHKKIGDCKKIGGNDTKNGGKG